MDRDEADRLLVASLREVRQAFDNDEDDWRHRLLRTYREYFKAIGLERPLLHPLQRMLNEVDDAILKKRSGRTRKATPLGRSLALTVAAACVTVLYERGDYKPVAKAVQVVAKTSGIDRKIIKEFRDNLNRGRAPTVATNSYKEMLAAVRDWPTDGMLRESLVGLGKFVP